MTSVSKYSDVKFGCHRNVTSYVQKTFARELEEAVAKATSDQEKLDQKRISELEEKHRQEITELLSESGISKMCSALENDVVEF